MIDPIEARFGALISALEPAARKILAAAIAKRLVASQSKRIADQKNPDGSDFEPRKPQLRNRRKNLRAGMFAKLRTSRYLKSSASSDGATLRFIDDVQRIAQVHQRGLRDVVDRKTRAEAQYPIRELLGLSGDDASDVEAQIIDHIARVL